jgi:hypothetical protein
MKLIKKQIKFVSGTTYNINILLTGDIKDMGVFDTVDVNSNYFESPAFSYPYNVTGQSSSRLSELEKFVVSVDPNVKYVGGGSFTSDGLHAYSITPTGSTYIYYLGGIQYTDVLASGSSATTTSFLFRVTSFSSDNFDYKRYIKDENKQNLVEKSQVNSDVFIVRQEQSVFEKNYRLRAINSLNNVLTYAGGNYFTIYNNT